MARTVFQFGTRAAALLRHRQVNTALGYPRTPTDDDRVGGGIHVPHADAVTRRHRFVRKHPTLALWWILRDVRTAPVLDGVVASTDVADADYDGGAEDPSD